MDLKIPYKMPIEQQKALFEPLKRSVACALSCCSSRMDTMT